MRPDSILIIDDEPLMCWSLSQELAKDGYPTLEAATMADGLKKTALHEPDLILLDQRLPDGTGIEFIQKLKETETASAIILLTAFDRSDIAVKAMKLGAYEYVTKPVDFEELRIVIQKALEESKLRRQLARLRQTVDENFWRSDILYVSSSMMKVLDFVKKVSQSNSTTVLITGKSGTGKELVARAIHSFSKRNKKPFMTINCPAIPTHLVESELFGHERGAFTDARSQQKGAFELADGGTIFLDEIGDMPLPLQVTLLRVMERKTFRRIGGTVDISVDVRVIAATNQEIVKLVEQGTFRQDLFYRLNVATINIPPLRDRGDDCILIAQHFVQQFNAIFHKNFKGLTEETADVFRQYAWPGNVRELRNIIERAVLVNDDEYLHPHHVELGPIKHADNYKSPLPLNGMSGQSSQLPLPSQISLTELECQAIIDALIRSNNNQSEAARLLKISRDKLRYRMKKHRIPRAGSNDPSQRR